MLTISPIFYPGGKTLAMPTIKSLIPQVKTMVSPFFGGGSIELTMSYRGVKVIGYDNFKPLVNFWKHALTDAEKLADACAPLRPVSKEKFKTYKLGILSDDGLDPFTKAVLFFVINRCSFGGTTFSGGMCIGHPRFNDSAIEFLRDLQAPNVSVEQSCFKESIPRHPDEFMYLDPPYMIDKGIYGVNGDEHDGFDHEALAGLLVNRDQWLLSYNDCEKVRDLYKGFKILEPSWTYRMNESHKSSEVLIMSKDLAQHHGFK